MERHHEAAKLDPGEQHHVITGPHQGLHLFLRRLEGTSPTRGIVLYVHGATFPSALSIAHRFDGRSWRDALCAAGLTVWGLDLQGFGASDRYPEMARPAEASAPLCDTIDAAAQVETATRFILEREQATTLSLLAHSWGTMVAGRVAGAHPEWIERVAMFAPIARREGAAAAPSPAWRIVTPQMQFARFTEDVPHGAAPVLSRSHFDEWAERYLDSDPQSRDRDPAGVKVPAGPAAGIARAWAGDLDYDPGLIRAPVAILRGEWDSLVTDADARWLWDALSASSIKRDVKIGRGTHLMHLEAARLALWRESVGFLLGDDVAAMPA